MQHGGKDLPLRLKTYQSSKGRQGSPGWNDSWEMRNDFIKNFFITLQKKSKEAEARWSVRHPGKWHLYIKIPISNIVLPNDLNNVFARCKLFSDTLQGYIITVFNETSEISQLRSMFMKPSLGRYHTRFRFVNRTFTFNPSSILWLD